MPSYGLSYLNEFTGHIDRAEEFHASDDVEAIHQIQAGPRRSDMELWCAARKICRFEATPNLFQALQVEPKTA